MLKDFWAFQPQNLLSKYEKLDGAEVMERVKRKFEGIRYISVLDWQKNCKK